MLKLPDRQTNRPTKFYTRKNLYEESTLKISCLSKLRETRFPLNVKDDKYADRYTVKHTDG